MKKLFLMLGMMSVAFLAACSNSDADLQKKVGDKLRTERLLNTVTVTAKDGNIMLGGEVDSQTQLKLAESMAREIDGVKKVDSKITIKGAEKAPSTTTGNTSESNSNMTGNSNVITNTNTMK